MIRIIAEVGSVHDGSFGNALFLIDAAAECGATAVKFQTHLPEAETLANAPSPAYFQAEPRFEYFRRTGFTIERWKELKGRCDERGVEFLSSPFSEAAVDLLEEVGVGEYKIPSGETTNIPLLERIGKTGKPVILSSGMNSWDEISEAVGCIESFHRRLTLLQCTSEYPCPYEQVGLNVMLEMKKRYGYPIGLSDHTLTIFAPIAAVALGATVIEKHFTFSRKMYGSDARHSLEPAEFRQMVEGIRSTERMIGSQVDKSAIARFTSMKEIFQKSVVTVVPIPAGTVITAAMIAFKKPGTGIPARDREKVLGRRARQALPADHLIAFSDLQE